MEIASRILEDRPFIRNFLAKSQTALLRQRLLAEHELDEAGIAYSREGYVHPFIETLSFAPIISHHIIA